MFFTPLPQNGFFRLARGVNNIGIESGACDWALPKDTWTEVTFPREKKEVGKEGGERLAETVWGIIQVELSSL